MNHEYCVRSSHCLSHHSQLAWQEVVRTVAAFRKRFRVLKTRTSDRARPHQTQNTCEQKAKPWLCQGKLQHAFRNPCPCKHVHMRTKGETTVTPEENYDSNSNKHNNHNIYDNNDDNNDNNNNQNISNLYNNNNNNYYYYYYYQY